jgi:hypothetical protein
MFGRPMLGQPNRPRKGRFWGVSYAETSPRPARPGPYPASNAVNAAPGTSREALAPWRGRLELP